MKALVVLAVLVAGCAPLDGYNCETLDEARCDGPKSVAFCESTSLGGKKWKAYDCPGGCSGSPAKCDFKGITAGIECSPKHKGRGWCSSAEGMVLIACIQPSADAGAVFASIPCQRCAQGADLCAPGQAVCECN